MEDLPIHEVILKFSEEILKYINATKTKDEFMAQFKENDFEGLRDLMGYCFYKTNEIAYNFLENDTPVAHPNLHLMGYCIAIIAHRIDVWDGDADSPYKAYCEFGKGEINREIALEILRNQQIIKDLSYELYEAWSAVHNKDIRARRVSW